ncbi:hypothetical protein FOZ63_007905, partial [Perkinsus olseni]
DVVLDYREKGAVGTLRDATLDAADLVADGLETAAGWMRDMLAGSAAPPPPPPPPATGGGANITLPPNMAICDQPITSTGGFLEQYRQQNGSQFASVLERGGEADGDSSSSSSGSEGAKVLGPGIDIIVDGQGAATIISVDRTLNPPLIVVRLATDGSRVVVDEDKCHLADRTPTAEDGKGENVATAHTEDLLDVGAEDKTNDNGAVDIGDGFKAVPMVGSTPASKISDKAADTTSGEDEVDTPAASAAAPTVVSTPNNDLLGLQDSHELFHDPALNTSLKKAEPNI